MKKLEEIKRRIKEQKLLLRERFKVKSIAIFGSYLRGEQSEESDIDIEDLLEAIEKIEWYVEELSFDEFGLGTKTIDAVINEVLKKMTPESSSEF